MRNDVRALRMENAQLSERVEHLEDQRALLAPVGPSRATAEAEPAAGEQPTLRAPPLTVIKLKPSVAPAPKLDTTVPVVEPNEDQLAALPETDAAPPPAPDHSEAEYQSAMEDLRTGNLANGVDRLERFAEARSKSELADNALYFAGVGRIGLEDFEGAARDFAQVIDQHPAGDAVADSMLKLAECRLKLNHAKDARALLARIVSTFPGTAAASQAERRLAALTP